jgi:hypothetical protein
MFMQTVVLQGTSVSDLKLVTELAKKIGISVKYYSEIEVEDIGMQKAIEAGKTGSHVDTKSFIKSLRQ